MRDELNTIRTLIETYDVGFLEADESEQDVPVYWAVKTLIEEHESLTKATEQAESALAAAAARIEQLEHTLKQIANRDDTEMAQARTLHYDMRGWARAALVPEDQSDDTHAR